MTSVLFVAVHPALELSRTNGLFYECSGARQRGAGASLYDLCGFFHFDVDHEQALLRSHAHIAAISALLEHACLPYSRSGWIRC